jgi:diguanylate cyclase (GGDEF)-like protein/PAS domain S-box-containing protein
VDSRYQPDQGTGAPATHAEAPVSSALDLAICRRQLELKSLLLENVGDGIIAHTLEGRIVYANRTAAQMLGYTADELRTLEPWGWIAPDLRDGSAGRVRQIQASAGLVYETVCHGRDGLVVCVEMHSRVVEIETWGELVVSVARDMAERSAAHETMHRLAFYDTLTGLSNRVLLDDRIDAALGGSRRPGETVGVIYMDLDDFKPINDTHGHAVGDCVLSIIAQRMMNCVRDTDTIARVGGDEFIALFPRLMGKTELGAKARVLAESVSQPVTVGDITVGVSVSVGLATYQNGEHYDELITRADHAMYRAKLAGRAGWEEFLATA